VANRRRTQKSFLATGFARLPPQRKDFAVTGAPVEFTTMNIRRITATRYVTPLREGGSLPAIVEGDDDGMYVLKFRGAGQGLKVLIAELIAGELARAAGLAVPDIVLMELDPILARSEPDAEIRDLVKASSGLNLGMDYLPGSLMFDPLINMPDADLASRIVWFDAFAANVDRTARNPNMLMWHRKLWLIDHGAALYVHHGDDNFAQRAREGFPIIADHVLMPRATRIAAIDEEITDRIGAAVDAVVALIPDEWLAGKTESSAAELRDEYRTYLMKRLESPRQFVEDAISGR
jgi:hypothetical protein